MLLVDGLSGERVAAASKKLTGTNEITLEGRADKNYPLAPSLNKSSVGIYVSPWVDGIKDKDGVWHLPEYECEIPGLNEYDPRNKKWSPGDWTPGVDNVAPDPEDETKFREWGGQKLWPGEVKPPDWEKTLAGFPEEVQEVLKVPHLPGQPLKEMFARMYAMDPRPFQDKHFEEAYRDLPKDEKKMRRFAKAKEDAYVHTEQDPAYWEGMEELSVPAVYPTPRPDTVTICVGIAGYDEAQDGPLPEHPEAYYDYLEYLYAKDQEGKVIQIRAGENCGMTKTIFNTYSFVPPVGTKSITPYAVFKIRGAWKGMPIVWDETVGSEEMLWFTKMPVEERMKRTDKMSATKKFQKEALSMKRPKEQKMLKPVLWPENSWEGNAARARTWDTKER